VAIQVGRTAFTFIALRKSLGTSHPLSRTFQRILTWFVGAGVLWIIGGLLEGEARYAVWLFALAVDFSGPVVGYYIPGLGRSRTEEWTIEGGHFAERCQLFVIIALGESILVTGTTFGQIEASTATVSAFVVAFLGSVALWWIYFARSAEAAREVFTSSEDPGRLGRSAYTYFHLPMIAGIIAVAAADELTVAHPGDRGTASSVALTLGGTALFLVGHAFFKWAVFEVLPWSRAVAIAALQQVASILTCPRFDAPWADQTGSTSSPHMRIMRYGSCPLKPAVCGGVLHTVCGVGADGEGHPESEYPNGRWRTSVPC